MGASHMRRTRWSGRPGTTRRARAMGFCLFNNVAVAAAHARALGAAKVAIVDFDVHHGNGTQQSSRPIRTSSTCRRISFPSYPGTGAADEIGRAAGRGHGQHSARGRAVDEDYQPRVRARGDAGAAAVRARPDTSSRPASTRTNTIRSAACASRPPAFAAMTSELRAVADECCRGRVVAAVEGGYDLKALAASLDASIGQPRAASRTPAAWPASRHRRRRAGRPRLVNCSEILAPHWTV